MKGSRRLAWSDHSESPPPKDVLAVTTCALDYLSSAGLWTLLSTGKSLQGKSGKLILVAIAGPLRQIIELAGFDKIFPLYATVDEARKRHRLFKQLALPG